MMTDLEKQATLTQIVAQQRDALANEVAVLRLEVTLLQQRVKELEAPKNDLLGQQP